MRELISIRYDPPLPGNPTTPLPPPQGKTYRVYHGQHNTKDPTDPTVLAVSEKGKERERGKRRQIHREGEEEKKKRAFATREKRVGV